MKLFNKDKNQILEYFKQNRVVSILCLLGAFLVILALLSTCSTKPHETVAYQAPATQIAAPAVQPQVVVQQSPQSSGASDFLMGAMVGHALSNNGPQHVVHHNAQPPQQVINRTTINKTVNVTQAPKPAPVTPVQTTSKYVAPAPKTYAQAKITPSVSYGAKSSFTSAPKPSYSSSSYKSTSSYSSPSRSYSSPSYSSSTKR